MDGVVFVGLRRPGLLSPKGKVLGGAFGGAVVGCTSFAKGETFGKGVLCHCTALVSAQGCGRLPAHGMSPRGRGASPEGSDCWVRTSLQGAAPLGQNVLSAGVLGR